MAVEPARQPSAAEDSQPASRNWVWVLVIIVVVAAVSFIAGRKGRA